jgi:hypothetical protein
LKLKWSKHLFDDGIGKRGRGCNWLITNPERFETAYRLINGLRVQVPLEELHVSRGGMQTQPGVKYGKLDTAVDQHE